MSTVTITKDNHQTEVLDSTKTVLLDFWASWCGPCRMIAPAIEEVAAERTDIVVGKINVDQEPDLAREYGIVSIPTLVVVKNGQVVSQNAGLRPKQAILAMLDAK